MPTPTEEVKIPTPTFENTSDAAKMFRSYLIFGKTKTGKTLLSTTLPSEKTLLVNVENNLDSVAGANIVKTNCFSGDEWDRLIKYLKSTTFPEWMFVDSITMLIQRIFVEEFKKTRDGRQAYSAIERKYNDIMADIKSAPCNIVCTAQCGMIKDEITGGLIHGAALPWAKLEHNLPYNFSAVFAARAEKDSSGKVMYALQCRPDHQYQVGARTNFGEENPLDNFELPDLMFIHTKITNPKKGH